MSGHPIARDRLRTLLDAPRKHRIAVVGDAMPGVYLHGDVGRVSPAAPGPAAPGRAGPAAGAALIGEMRGALGADSRGLVAAPPDTTAMARVVAPAQQVVRVDE